MKTLTSYSSRSGQSRRRAAGPGRILPVRDATEPITANTADRPHRPLPKWRRGPGHGYVHDVCVLGLLRPTVESDNLLENDGKCRAPHAGQHDGNDDRTERAPAGESRRLRSRTCRNFRRVAPATRRRRPSWSAPTSRTSAGSSGCGCDLRLRRVFDPSDVRQSVAELLARWPWGSTTWAGHV